MCNSLICVIYCVCAVFSWLVGWFVFYFYLNVYVLINEILQEANIQSEVGSSDLWKLSTFLLVLLQVG